jgi:hypothetical protein
MYRAAALAFATCFLFTTWAGAQNTEFTETLKKNRAPIGVQDGKLAGPGAEVHSEKITASGKSPSLLLRCARSLRRTVSTTWA